MRSKELLKIIIANLGVISTIFLAGEFITRAIFPEFKGDYYSNNITRGIKTHSGDLDDLEILRTPNNEYSVDKNTGIFIIVGDSITYGFGTPYEEIYWVRMQKKYNLSEKQKLTFIPLAGYGARLDILPEEEKLIKLSNSFKGKNKTILYQFNFNDIYPFSESIKRSEKKYLNLSNPIEAIKIIRWTHMNKSVLFRVATHYGGLTKRLFNINKSCKEKGIDSLGAYTWAYGSKHFKKESEEEWLDFEIRLKNLKELSQKINAKLFIFISPILYDIDLKGLHPHYNTYGLDFSCATINPRDRLTKIAKKMNIDLIDPTIYVRDRFEFLVKEGNFKPFFFAADDNHFNPTASVHISDYLFQKIFKPLN